jgi:hypothetical protein
MGQINMDCKLGQMIAKIAGDSRYSTFCEVGTWNGQGSTMCIYEGIKNRPSAHLYSIEGDPFMMMKAEALWKGNPQVTLLMGTLHRDIMTEEGVESHPRFHTVRDHYRLHYTTELRAAKLTPLVKPPPCDVILLDGGEFSTEGDWKALYHDNLKVAILDDTQVIKTNRILNQLLKDPAWTCLYNEPHDRNGWAIFERAVGSE